MTRTYGDVLRIMRAVVGEQDGNDPDAQVDVLMRYIADFVQLSFGDDADVKELYTWWEFTTTSGTDEYSFADQGFTRCQPTAWITDTNNSDIELAWFYDPGEFFWRHPLTASEEDNGKPVDLLYWDNKVTLRPPPNDTYTVRIVAYKELQVNQDNDGDYDQTQPLEQDYFLRMLAYGAAMDYLADHGRIEEVSNVKPLYDRYKALIAKRTAKKLRFQRARQVL